MQEKAPLDTLIWDLGLVQNRDSRLTPLLLIPESQNVMDLRI